MQRTMLTAGVACLALVLGAPTAGAKPDHPTGHGSSDAAKFCAAAKKADKAAFKALWGKHAMRECIRAGREADSGEEATNAAQECRAEQAADPAAFAETYGTNANDRNAFGKCVSIKVHEDEEEGETA